LKADPSAKGKLMVDPEARQRIDHSSTSEAIIWNIRWISLIVICYFGYRGRMWYVVKNTPVFATAEFLWQEGHTAHATRRKAIEETKRCFGYMQPLQKNIWHCR
jgi:prolyl-tRNA synthetase